MKRHSVVLFLTVSLLFNAWFPLSVHAVNQIKSNQPESKHMYEATPPEYETAATSAPSIVFNKSEVLRPTKSLFYPSVNNIKTADFTGNGILDVVYTIGSELGICLNHGGKLQPPIIIDAYKYSHEMVIADLTGNGHPDIAYTVPGPPHNLFAGAVHLRWSSKNRQFC